MKRAQKLWAGLAAAAIAAAGAIVPLTVSSSAATVPLLGSYNGAANTSGSSSFASETGSSASIYSDYAAGENETWTNWSNTIAWLIPQLKGQLGSSRLELSVPLASGGYSSQAAALAAFAANPATFDANMASLAQTLVSNGFSNTIIRLMWEPQELGLYSNDDLTSAANYAALFRDAHQAMDAVSGASFQFAWYWEANFDASTNNAAYPGSAYVDYVTNDFYDQSWVSSCGVAYNGTAFSATQENCLWSAPNGYAATLKNLTNFATQAGKPIGIGEWGVIDRPDNHGGNDDPTFIANYTAWMKANNVAWASYFNFNDGGLNSTLSAFPNSLAAYKADLSGGGSSSSSPPVTTTTTTQPHSTTTTTTQPHSTTTTTQPQGSTTTTTTSPPSGVVVSRVSPSSGSTLGGTTVTITGSGFTGTSAVDFGTVPATIASVSATALTVTSPASGAGTVDVTVAASLGRSQPNAVDHFVYVAPTPSVSSVSPAAGSASGGTAVTITGNGFTGATKVSFGSAGASFSVNSNSSISATAPVGAAGSVDITVTGPGGTSAVVTADKFTYGPVVTSVSPHSGSHLGGTTVTVNGAGFTGATAVSFGGTPVTGALSVNSTGTQITVASPAHAAGAVDVTVTVGGATSQPVALDSFTFI